ncbi:MAG TPA: hypothetical protein VEI96_10920 [Thermodesulfovibrionales bacterium]|nr:hypothetical protein [Thermodesulfovibrionales bacterium]
MIIPRDLVATIVPGAGGGFRIFQAGISAIMALTMPLGGRSGRSAFARVAAVTIEGQESTGRSAVTFKRVKGTCIEKE